VRVKDMLKVIVGITLGASLVIFGTAPSAVVEPQECDYTEEVKLRVIMNECSQAVMYYVWGDDNEESSHEEE
jgi:hypothetical protein